MSRVHDTDGCDEYDTRTRHASARFALRKSRLCDGSKSQKWSLSILTLHQPSSVKYDAVTSNQEMTNLLCPHLMDYLCDLIKSLVLGLNSGEEPLTEKNYLWRACVNTQNTMKHHRTHYTAIPRHQKHHRLTTSPSRSRSWQAFFALASSLSVRMESTLRPSRSNPPYTIV